MFSKHHEKDTVAMDEAPQALHSAALDYLKRGFSIFPARVADKKPAILSWKEFQSRLPTEDEVRSWFQGADPHKTAIAIVTGSVSGLAVVDFDTTEAITYAKENNFPITPIVKTGKGYHAYYRYRDGLRNFQARANLPGIDLRAEGGYVLAPPSFHPSGKQYCWVKQRDLDALPLADGPWDILFASTETGLLEQRPLLELYQGVDQGQRNISLARLTGSWVSDGLTIDECLEQADIWNSKNCPPLSPEEIKKTVKSIFLTRSRNNEKSLLLSVLSGPEGKNLETFDWTEPSPLPEGLAPVKPLDPAMIPVPLKGWLMDISDRMQIPPDFSTAAAIVALGSIIGRGCGIYPKRHDDWLVVPNLWGAVVGRPSLMKTPAISEAQRHIMRLESEARELYDEEKQAYEIDREIIKVTRSAITEDIKKAIKKDNTEGVEAARIKLAELQENEPVRRRYQTQDGTVEKIGELLNQNPRGLLINRDELIGWLRSLDKDGHENDRSFYLEAWNGNRSYTYDRIGRGTLDIQATCLSIFGAITPGALSTYVYHANRGGSGDDGLLQRFQVLVWPDAPSAWRNVDRFPDTTEKNRVWEIFKMLSGDIPGAIMEEGNLPAFRFSSAGQEVFDTWRHDLEKRLRGDHGLPPALESHLTKYRKLMPSLALIFHLLDVVNGIASGQVSERAAVMAAVWCDYLESHAERTYGAVIMPGMEAAREIIKHVRRGSITDGMKLRDIHRNQWTRLTTPDEVRAGLEVLQSYDWLIHAKTMTGGRPSEVIRLNPKIQL